MKAILIILMSVFSIGLFAEDFKMPEAMEKRLREYNALKQRKDLKEIYRVANAYIEKEVKCHFRSDLEAIKNGWARIDVQTCDDKHKDCGDYNVFLKMENGKWKPFAIVYMGNVWDSKVPCFIWRGFTEEQCNDLKR